MSDPFAVLGIPRAFEVDLVALERVFKDKARQWHPDRHARGGAEARRVALQQTVALNDAYRIVKDPMKRAETLLRLHGVAVGDESNAVGADLPARPPPVPQALLMEIMELRMALGEAREAGDVAKIAALSADVRAKQAASNEALAQGLAAGTAEGLAAASASLVALRYWKRFLDEAEGVREEPAHG